MMEKLREALAKQEEVLKEWAKAPKPMISSANGPVAIGVIRAIVAVMDEQSKEIEKLKKEITELRS